MIRLYTSLGNIDIELNEKKAPLTVKNFEDYVTSGFYDGTIFHRVIDGFMIQGGGFDQDMQLRSTRDPIKNEADNGLRNEQYSVAMARTNDPHSATAQFFINVKDNDFLNYTAKNEMGWGYCVFGKVVAGEEVVDKIKQQATGRRGMHSDVPLEPIVISKAEKLA
ncbi:MAG: peptidylprolyl isomerase [Neisseriaceae bacterium]